MARHRFGRYIACTVSALVLFAAGAAWVPSSTVQAASDPVIVVPQDLFKTPADKTAKKRFDEVLKLFTDRYWRRLSAEEVFRKMITGGLTSLDPHTKIMDANEYVNMEDARQGEFGGIGIEVQLNDGGIPGVVVISPIDDTPADRAGIKPRDVIVKIGEKATASMTLQQAVEMMRGKPGTSVTLSVYRDGSREPLTFTLVREIIRIQYVKYELRENGIGYIRVTSFVGRDVPRDVLKAIRDLKRQNGDKELTGIVLDLKNNPGGLLNGAEAVSDLFLSELMYFTPSSNPLYYRRPNGPFAVISTEHRGKITPEFDIDRAYRGDATNGTPLVVLVNEGSASASEIVAKALQVYGRATIAGPAKTFGKGTVQSVLELDTGGALLLTTAQYLIGPSGCEKAVQGEGVTPDIFIKDKDGQTQFRLREEDLPDNIDRSDTPSGTCAHDFSLPASHREAARAMLEKLGYTIIPKEENR